MSQPAIVRTRAIRTIDDEHPLIKGHKTLDEAARELHKKICDDLDPHEFSEEEVAEEFANSDGVYKFGYGSYKTPELLDYLVGERLIEEVGEGVFCVLQDAEPDDLDDDNDED